ncbi:type IV pilus assembly protein PilZ [Leptospira broomii serovar Hurstbridge str. 5399]|uniref:Type IV pilus assembly protein PilZ n=1 Tax=Leptospira broomii serovar Hurstbridge str. 5399 TaxID=1049789 RepID=T0GPM5_9LEPT|nr:PilZ domain-containing protein [Leptospira broomii]EQA47283.1 type IV pilus assembly protein PilZ [Leptospira broomii serovar Hurstbridge str. 5399]
MRERRQSERIYSEELCKFKVTLRFEEVVFNGFLMNISEIGIGVVGTIKNGNSFAVGTSVSGQIQFPDSWDKLKFNGDVARKEYISNDAGDSLVLGIKFANRISLPISILKLALLAGGKSV